MAWPRFFRRARRDHDAEREIASYIAIETDDNIARGMAPQAAHDAAVRKFGNTARVREEIYWMNTLRPIDAIWQDLRYAVRLLLRDKGFAAAAIISLALGIGANTAIFQLLDTVRLRTLPVEQPEELVEVRIPPGTPRIGSFTGRRPMLTYPLFDAGKLVAVGLIIGAALGLGAANAARSLLFGLTPTDPLTLAAAITMLAVIGFAASYLPAHRASRLDPVRMLRDE